MNAENIVSMIATVVHVVEASLVPVTLAAGANVNIGDALHSSGEHFCSHGMVSSSDNGQSTRSTHVKKTCAHTQLAAMILKAERP